MKSILFISIMIILLSCSSRTLKPSDNQKFSSDSLRKFSYNIYGFKNIPGGYYKSTSTGFFIRRSNRLFFITAKHVILGCNNDLTKNPLNADTLFISNDKNQQNLKFSMDTRASKKNSTCTSVTEKPDMFFIEYANDDFSKINYKSLETHLLPELNIVGDISIFGYPSSTKDDFKSNNLYIPSDKLRVSSKAIRKNKTDSINYYIESAYVKSDSSMKGYSGSPVFIQDQLSKQWRVLGIFVAGTDTTKGNNGQLIVCKIQYVLSEIDGYIKRTESKRGL